MSLRRFENLNDWLAWLETLHPKAIDMGLARVRAVAERLGVLTPGVPVITVAGTNGKGSTTAFLEALLRAHGLRAGCYTSPHILKFNERIRLHGEDVGDEELVTALAAVDAARDDISLTYFEFTTLAAFVIFRAAKLDAWVLEIGLGGRLDAVNVIDADVAVLTSVGLDHQEWLGDTREAIGREKAGIFRNGKPAVIGDPEPPASVLAALATVGARGHFAGSDFRWDAAQNDWQWRGRDRAGAAFSLRELPLPALALANAATALQAFVLLPLVVVDAAAVRAALLQVQLPGRNQRVLRRGRPVVLDVGHNADALLFLRAELQRHQRGERFHIVLGMLADKDIAAAVRVLEPLAQSWHIAPLPSPRSATIMQLQAALAGSGPLFAHACIGDALWAACASDDGLPVLVTGSFYSVSEAMCALAKDLPEQAETFSR